MFRTKIAIYEPCGPIGWTIFLPHWAVCKKTATKHRKSVVNVPFHSHPSESTRLASLPLDTWGISPPRVNTEVRSNSSYKRADFIYSHIPKCGNKSILNNRNNTFSKMFLHWLHTENRSGNQSRTDYISSKKDIFLKKRTSRIFRASMAQRQSVGLWIERSRVRNSLVPSGFSFWQENESALLNGPVHWECSLGGVLTTN